MKNSTVKIHALNEKYFKESPYKITNIYLEDISELSTLISYLYKKQQDIQDMDESLIHVQSDSLTLNLIQDISYNIDMFIEVYCYLHTSFHKAEHYGQKMELLIIELNHDTCYLIPLKDGKYINSEQFLNNSNEIYNNFQLIYGTDLSRYSEFKRKELNTYKEQINYYNKFPLDIDYIPFFFKYTVLDLEVRKNSTYNILRFNLNNHKVDLSNAQIYKTIDNFLSQSLIRNIINL